MTNRILLFTILFLTLSCTSRKGDEGNASFEEVETSAMPEGESDFEDALPATADFKTNYTWNIDSMRLPIYISFDHRAYIIRRDTVSGEEYRFYLPDEVTEQIIGGPKD